MGIPNQVVSIQHDAAMNFTLLAPSIGTAVSRTPTTDIIASSQPKTGSGRPVGATFESFY